MTSSKNVLNQVISGEKAELSLRCAVENGRHLNISSRPSKGSRELWFTMENKFSSEFRDLVRALTNESEQAGNDAV
jgi:hypothetical protein